MAGSYVFISYAHADLTYVTVLTQALDEAGVPWWYDERLASGDRFARVLRDQIDRCAAFIVVMSPAAHRSTYVAKEVRRALRCRRPIHPLLLSGDPLPAVANRHYVSVEVAWIDAENADLIPGQLADLAPPLGLPAADATQTATQALAALERIELTWLLVHDNAIRPHDLEPWLPRGGNPHGDVIITSGGTQWAELATTLDIDVMTYDEAVALLKTRVPGIDESVAGEIVEYLGRLPLAVDLAGGFLATNHTPPGWYLQMLRSAGDEVTRLFDESERVGCRHTIATVWEPMRADLEQVDPAAAQLLRLCAFLAPEPIPLDLFTNHPDVLPEPLASAAADPVSFERTVGQILRRSLARRHPDGLTVHRLLAATIRRPTPTGVREKTARVLRQLLYGFLPGEIMRAPQNWPVWRRLLPHVLAATESETTHHGEHDPIARLLHRAAAFLQTQGQARAALPLLERALRIAEGTHGPDDHVVASRLADLALVLHDLGEAEAARPLLERALRIVETTRGHEHPYARIFRNRMAHLSQPHKTEFTVPRGSAI